MTDVVRYEPASSREQDATGPLLGSTDDRLLDELLRLCAAAGVTGTVASDVAGARRHWGQAPLVVIGEDMCVFAARAHLPRRADVAVVTGDADHTEVWSGAVAVGADQVYVVPRDEDRFLEQLAGALERTGQDAQIVAVIGGSGGAGASCFATTLAVLAAQQHQETLLVDADPLGGGIDLVLGDEDVSGLRWPDLAGTEGRISGQALRRALPATSGLAMLSWDRGDPLAVPPESMRSVLAAGRRSHELVVVDVARGVDTVAEEVLVNATTTLLVVAAEIRAVAAAARVLGRVRESGTDVALVVRRPGSGGLDAAVVEETLAAPVVAQMRTDARVARAIDEGLGPATRRRGPLVRAARRVLGQLPARAGPR